jgi:signal transduction histidine kinase
VSADEMLLVSALSNLVNNAIKFSRTGGHVTLSCRTDHRNVLIEVEDECGGLSDGDPALAFVAEAPENISQKLGLGLTITRRAVEAMNGSLYVENNPGHGCLFGVAFPPAQPNRTSSVPPPPPNN